jgi:tetratricopeptide (TPR) repeat protein
MKRLLHIGMLALLGCGDPAERAVEEALHEGAEPYRMARYDSAATIYGQASFDPRVAHDLGSALYRQGLLDTAISTFEQAIASARNRSDQALAYYDLGNSWMGVSAKADSLDKDFGGQLSQIKIEGDDIALKVKQFVLRDSLRTFQRKVVHLVDSSLTQGAEAYKNALRNNPKDEDARHNLALAQQQIAARQKAAQAKSDQEKNKNKDKDKDLSEQAKRIMQQADSLVERYKFKEALGVLAMGLKKEPTLKQQQEYMNKLDVVTRAAEAQ